MKNEEKIGHSYLKKIMDYDPSTGILRWRVARRSFNGIVKAGSIAGGLDRNGHRRITLDGIRLMAHRVAWFHYYGTWPVGEIDHRNMVPDDNRIENLRDVGLNRGLQRANQRVRCDNLTGLKGVSKTKSGKFVARLGKRYLGVFGTAEEAQAVYIAEAIKLFGEFARAA